MHSSANPTRRDFVMRSAYVTPAIVTMMAAPSFAKAGSVKEHKDKDDKKAKVKPKG